jgi:hypothetical protein
MNTRRWLFVLFCSVLSAATPAWCTAPQSKLADKPELTLSLRGATGAGVQVGEPIFVAVRVELPDGRDQPLELAPASVRWTDAVVVELVQAADGVVVAQGKPVLAEETTGKTLTADEPANGLWLIESAATGKLSPGDFAVRARFNLPRRASSPADAEADAVSEIQPLQILAESQVPQAAPQRTVALAREAALTGKLQESAQLLDGALAVAPDDVNLLMARAQLSRRGGDLQAAMLCVNRALQIVEGQPDRHPPTALFELADQLEVARTAGPAERVAAPEWAKLPETLRGLLSGKTKATGVGNRTNP